MPASHALLLLTACHPPRDRPDPVVFHPDGTPALAQDAEVESASVVLNELMPKNDSTIQDETGEPGDWVELYNAGEATVDLEGWGLGPDAEDGPEWTFPEPFELGAGERLLVWTDGDPEQGALHADLGLDADDGELVLFDPLGSAVETWVWTEVPGDVALGRFPDGAAATGRTIEATPWLANPWDPGQSTDPSDAIFREDRVITLDLWLPEEGREALDADPYTWTEGALGFEGAWLEPVGIRIKGRWGSYRTLSQKAALKIGIDEYDDFRLRGLDNLTLNNMVQDPSCVHERLAYSLLRDAGVPAPRTGYAALYLNGEYRGLYANIETPDERFLERWFANAEGNLYEGSYGPDLSSGSYTALELDQDGDEDKEVDVETAEAYVRATLDFLDAWTAGIVAELFPDGEPGYA